jgi:hypothetical protein
MRVDLSGPHSGASRRRGIPRKTRDAAKFAELESGAVPWAHSEEACLIDALRRSKSAVSYPQHECCSSLLMHDAIILLTVVPV